MLGGVILRQIKYGNRSNRCHAKSGTSLYLIRIFLLNVIFLLRETVAVFDFVCVAVAPASYGSIERNFTKKEYNDC